MIKHGVQRGPNVKFANCRLSHFLQLGFRVLGMKKSSADHPQSNDWYMNSGPTKLVQYSADRRSSHRRNGASSLISNMGWQYRKPVPLGRKGAFYYLFLLFLPAFTAPRARGGGRQHPVSPMSTSLFESLIWSYLVWDQHTFHTEHI